VRQWRPVGSALCQKGADATLLCGLPCRPARQQAVRARVPTESPDANRSRRVPQSRPATRDRKRGRVFDVQWISVAQTPNNYRRNKRPCSTRTRGEAVSKPWNSEDRCDYCNALCGHASKCYECGNPKRRPASETAGIPVFQHGKEQA